MGDIFEGARPEFVEYKIESAVYMVAHSPRYAYSARRTFGLEPGCHIHAISVQIRAIGNHVTDVDANTKSNGLIGRLIAIVDRHLLLHFDCAAHCSIDAIEHDEQRITSGLNE